jgi:ribosomal protein L11 methyltransferase
MSSFWIAELALKAEVRLPSGERLGREDFFAWLWQELQECSLQGVHEGTMLCDEAAEAGLETESWLVDSGEAPSNRDWVGAQSQENPQLYFPTEADARQALERLEGISGCTVVRLFEQENQDWDAEWKRNFRGVEVPPDWKIVPPWEANDSVPGRKVLVVNPGAGFGTGTHETTQLCLQALSESLIKRTQPESVLDFGSGSGILAIGAALRGARLVHAVEIDPLAIDNARENARLNRVEDRVRYEADLSELKSDEPAAGYSVIFANILKPVLLEFSRALCSRVRAGGVMILSGLIEADVEPVKIAYSTLLPGRKSRVLARNEWRAIVFEDA